MNLLKIYDPVTGKCVELVRIKKQAAKGAMIRAFNSIGYCTREQIPAARKELAARKAAASATEPKEES